MGLIYTIVAALCAWIVMWAVGISGFDAGLLALLVMVIAVGFQMLVAPSARHD